MSCHNSWINPPPPSPYKTQPLPLPGGNASSDSGSGNSASDKNCPTDNGNDKCDMEFVRDVYYGGETKACVYKGKGGIFTFPQDKELACMPVNKQRCLVDTSFMGSKARAIYGK